MGDCAACADRGGDKGGLGQLRVVCTGLPRRLGVKLNAVRALGRERDRDGHQLLLAGGQRTLGECDVPIAIGSFR